MTPSWSRILIVLSTVLPVMLSTDMVYAEQANRGKDNYVNLCASCHGTSGKGDGPVGKFLNKPPADLTKLSERNSGVFPSERVYEIIDGRQEVGVHGPREMPIWGRAIPIAPARARARIQEIVDYLATLQGH
jgi:mono/diheme cytochrome c family protein